MLATEKKRKNENAGRKGDESRDIATEHASLASEKDTELQNETKAALPVQRFLEILLAVSGNVEV